MKEARKNSVMQLSELYNVVIGIALSLAIYNTIDGPNTSVSEVFRRLPNFCVVLFLIIPFYHGAVRHLFATYVEGGGSSRIKNGALMADFVLLFVEGCVFVGMATYVDNILVLAWSVFTLLILDSIWGFFAWLVFTGAQSQYAEKKWAMINIFTAALILITLQFEPIYQLNSFNAALILATVVGIRTVTDYILTWDFYFPPEETSETAGSSS